MEYSYYNPTAIQFGKGQIKSIVNFISKDQKVLSPWKLGETFL